MIVIVFKLIKGFQLILENHSARFEPIILDNTLKRGEFGNLVLNKQFMSDEFLREEKSSGVIRGASGDLERDSDNGIQGRELLLQSLVEGGEPVGESLHFGVAGQHFGEGRHERLVSSVLLLPFHSASIRLFRKHRHLVSIIVIFAYHGRTQSIDHGSHRVHRRTRD